MASTLRLGDVASSEQLIQDLYLNLRRALRSWSALTKQTSQARMGYVGQHLVSVVTGFPGGKSGARGVDIRHHDGTSGEIKTCYRVDQLGRCADRACRSAVAPDEEACTVCGSKKIERKEDSKWLIGLQNEDEFGEILVPTTYYLVLFEFQNFAAPDVIQASIWTVDPRNPGFLLCMVDYFMNTRAGSKSKAPFNMWPYSLKFELMKPRLIYRSLIGSNDTITTLRFPGRDDPSEHVLSSMDIHARARVGDDIWAAIAKAMGSPETSKKVAKSHYIKFVEAERAKHENANLCDLFARALYRPLVTRHLKTIPVSLRAAVKSALGD